LRAVVQRVSEARVVVGGDVVGEIGNGLCVLLGIAENDDQDAAGRLAHKVAQLRIFENEDGKFDRSVVETHGSALVVSQFTLIADSKRQRGTRPSFTHAAKPHVAEPLYEAFIGALRDEGIDVQTGIFGARMALELVNDGPVTIILET
jgi:D-tyrosyl-tRNA(Tyr) deacylase